MQTEHGYAPVNGTRLYYEICGAGDPLVLIHGNTLDTRCWDDQFAVFARHYRVIRYDMRGYGQSALPTSESYTPADDLMALLSWLDIGHAHILGLSRGGAVAIDFALAFAQATDTLILADTGLWRFDWQEFGEFSSRVRAAGMASGLDAAREQWLAGALFAPVMTMPAVAERLKQMVTDYSGWHWLHKESLDLMEPPQHERFDAIVAPTLVLVGEQDLPDFHAIAQLILDGVPDAKRLVLPGVGHLSNMEDPVRFNQAVLDFLAEKKREH